MEVLYKDDFSNRGQWNSMVEQFLANKTKKLPTPREIEDVEEMDISLLRVR